MIYTSLIETFKTSVLLITPRKYTIRTSRYNIGRAFDEIVPNDSRMTRF